MGEGGIEGVSLEKTTGTGEHWGDDVETVLWKLEPMRETPVRTPKS